MDPDVLGQAVAHAGIAAVGIGFLAGLAFSFNPVALASIPVSLAYVTKARERKQAILLGSIFVLGMIIVQTVLGFVAGLGGRWVALLIGREWGLVLGPLLIVLGLIYAGWLRISFPTIPVRAKRPTASWGAFLLGAAFAVAVCPVCTPALVVLLGAAAGLASPWVGAILLLAFALGRAIPIATGSITMGWLESLDGLAAYSRAFEILGGVLLIVSGLYMLNAYFFWVPALA